MLNMRGGGHSVTGHGTLDGGIVIDLSPMRSVRVLDTGCQGYPESPSRTPHGPPPSILGNRTRTRTGRSRPSLNTEKTIRATSLMPSPLGVKRLGSTEKSPSGPPPRGN